MTVGFSADRVVGINNPVLSAVEFANPTTTNKLLPQQHPNSFANAINNAGQIVGGIGTFTNSKAFFYDSGIVTEIGTLPGTDRSSATAINSSRQVQVVGLSQNGLQTPSDRGFIWQNGVLTNLGLPSVAGPVASIAFVEGINDQGWVTGSWQNWVDDTPQPRRAFLYKDGVMVDLLPSVLQSDAFDINNLGQIIGDAEVTSGDFTSFIWDNGQFFRLSELIDPASGWTIFGVEAINDEGQIIGFGEFNGVSQSFILNPVTIPTPVPASVWLFGSGLAALLGLRRRRA
jgi:probable HAF family extracellular repeat protein